MQHHALKNIHLLVTHFKLKYVLVEFLNMSEGNLWLCHSSHLWHLARPLAAVALACFFKEQEAGDS
jgi:hypothetical protein